MIQFVESNDPDCRKKTANWSTWDQFVEFYKLDLVPSRLLIPWRNSFSYPLQCMLVLIQLFRIPIVPRRHESNGSTSYKTLYIAVVPFFQRNIQYMARRKGPAFQFYRHCETFR